MVATGKTNNPGMAGGTTAAAPLLSPAQERLWFLDQINPGDASLSIARAVTINGPLQPELLQRCLRQTVARHESLRTTFATTQLYAGVDSRPAQIVADSRNACVDVVDISETLEQERDGNLRRLLRRQIQHGFDLSLGPLIRLTLIKLAEQSHVLLIVAHRIIADEESLNILFRELFQLYEAGPDAGDRLLPPLPIQYRDYAARQLNVLESEAAQAPINYWRETLAGAPAAIELPGDRIRPGLRTSAGATVATRLNGTLVSSLQILSDREEVRLSTTLLAAFAVLLSRYSRQNDLVVGLGVTNRQHDDARNLIGPISLKI